MACGVFPTVGIDIGFLLRSDWHLLWAISSCKGYATVTD